MTQKSSWLSLLFADILLFLLGITTNSFLCYGGVLLLSFYIYKNGDAILFKEYNERRQQKRQAYQVAQTAVKTTIQTGQLLKKKER